MYENNLEDKIRDGTLLRGEKKHNTKITEALVICIKNSWKPINDPEHLSFPERAKLFDVSTHIIISIDYGYSWLHIPGKNDEVIKEKIKSVKKKREVIRLNTRTDGLSEKEYDMLKTKIYSRSTVAESTKNDISDVPCRMWNGCVHENYGRIQHNHIKYFVHLLVCECKNKQKKPDGMVTRHLCNNKLCVEEQHLEFGTSNQNMIDAINDGNLKTKLTSEKAKKIRKELEKDFSKMNISKLAEEYDVSSHTIKNLKYNSQWKET